MSAKTKKKLCWNCEGNVDQKNEACPYCGVSLNVSPIAGTKPEPKPPYRPGNSKAIPAAPYSVKEEPLAAAEETSNSSNDFRTLVSAMASLLLGAVLAIFSLVLALFSDDKGVFTLRWQSSYWYVYLVLALPLLWYGWQASARLNAAEEE